MFFNHKNACTICDVILVHVKQLAPSVPGIYTDRRTTWSVAMEFMNPEEEHKLIAEYNKRFPMKVWLFLLCDFHYNFNYNYDLRLPYVVRMESSTTVNHDYL